jgi:hypothetical protein
LTGYGATLDLSFQAGAGSYNVSGLPTDFINSFATEAGKYVITGYEAGYILIRDAWYPRPFDQDQWNASQVQTENWTPKAITPEAWQAQSNPSSVWTDASQSLESWTSKGPSQ